MAAYSSCLQKELGMDQHQALPKSLQLIVASPEAADAAESKSGESSPLQNTASPQTNQRLSSKALLHTEEEVTGHQE